MHSPQPQPSPLRLDYVGDIAIGPILRRAYAEHGADFISAPWRDTLAGADLAIANHEYVYHEAGQGDVPYPSRMIAEPPIADVWTRMPFHVVTLANNHIADAGPAGVSLTRNLMEERGIACIGAGRDPAAARTPWITTRNGWRIAHIGACEFPLTYAGEHTAGTMPMQLEPLRAAIAAVRRDVDLVAIVLHSDVEFVRYPSPFRRQFSRALIDAGADLVMQHHPHVLQGVENYKNGLIAYSLGNFVFAFTRNSYLGEHEGTTDSAILRVHIDPAAGGGFRLRHEWVPLVLDSFGRPCEPKAADRERILAEVAELSAVMHDEAELRRRWRATAKQQLIYNLRHSYYAWHHNGLRAGLGFFTNMYGKHESHHWLRALFV